jgi:hypothetical protein
MSAEKHALEQERLDCICANKIEAQCDAQKKKKHEQSVPLWKNQTEEMRVIRHNYTCDYMRKKMAKEMAERREAKKEQKEQT